MTGESGYVASEGFPNLYPPNKKCIWTITVRRLPLVTIALYQSPKPNPESSGNCLFGHKGGRPAVSIATFLLFAHSHYWKLNPVT